MSEIGQDSAFLYHKNTGQFSFVCFERYATGPQTP